MNAFLITLGYWLILLLFGYQAKPMETFILYWVILTYLKK